MLLHKDSVNSLPKIPDEPPIIINVSGFKFTIYRQYLRRYPNTLLGSEDLDKFYDANHDDYFFDTNPLAFESIFDFYLYGKLYQPANLPNEIFQNSVDFFRMMTVFEDETPVEEEKSLSLETVGSSKVQQLRSSVSYVLNNPSATSIGRIYGWCDLSCIFLSIILMMFETDPNVVVLMEDKNTTVYKVCYVLETMTVIYFTFDILLRYVIFLELQN